MNSKNFKLFHITQTVKSIIFLLTVSFLSVQLQAQISRGGEPASFRFEKSVEKEKAYSPRISFSLEKLEKIEKQCIAYEFGKILPFKQKLQSPDFGKQIVDRDGNMVWKATITSENALALGLYFSDFFLPKGAELFIYSPDKEQIIGSFTEINNSESGVFATELIFGDKLIIEYNEPAAVAGLGRFTIDEVLHAYRGVNNLKSSNTNGFGGSGSCEVNVNCSEGADYENQKNSVVRLLIKEGSSSYWCTGSVINNVNNDRTPYILSAWHCFDEVTSTDLNQMIVYFNYQSATCDNPSVEPIAKTMTGATKIASSSNSGTMGSDFYLVELQQNIPVDYNAYFMGWDRTGNGSTNGVTIHHPQGDIKKISTYITDLTTTTYSYTGAAINGSWEVVWRETTNGHGVTEGGSSGSPIYSQNGFIIGTLTGGGASCTNLFSPDYYSKFDFHWDKNGINNDDRLKPWLDPDNTGTTILQGVTVGIEEITKIADNFFTLFPNPSNGQIVLQFNESAYGKTFNIRISNMLGQSIYQDKLTVTKQMELNLQYLQKGFYFLEIDGNGQRQTQKISIQ